MNSKKYKLAGWLSILVAIVFVPKFILNFIIEVLVHKLNFPGIYMLDAFIVVVLTLIYVFLLLTLRQLLNERYNFYEVDKLISISYCCLIVTGFITIMDDVLKTVGIIGQDFSALKIVLIGPFFFVLFIMGIVSIIFAIKLLRLKGDLFGMLKVYVWCLSYCFRYL